jgi:hypothetical protein
MSLCQFMQGSQSTSRSLGVQSQQLLTESQVFEQKVFPGAKSADHPAEEMPEQYDHGKNLIGTVRIELFRQIIHFAGVRRFGETQPVAEWNCRALSGKLPTRSAGPRHRSERTAPEAPSCRLPPLLSRRPDASGSSQRDSQPPDRLPAAGPHHRSATTRRFAAPLRPRGAIPSKIGSYSVPLPAIFQQ